MSVSAQAMFLYWNALVAAAETTNKLSLRLKTALFTNLWYILPLIDESICVLVPSKARNMPVAWIMYMYACSNNLCTVHAQ